jgi:hypothetical protein
MRYLKLSILFVLVSAFGVGLGALSQEAAAGKVCQKLNLAKNCVVGSDVKNLKAWDIKDEAGADYHILTDQIPLTIADKVIRTVTLTAPRPGIVIVNASGYFDFDAGSQIARCAITTGTTIGANILVIAENDNLISYLPWASVRAFEVLAGDFTVRVVCDLFAGSATFVSDTSLVALYVPTRY